LQRKNEMEKIEHFLKSGDRFLDKKCGENNKWEPSVAELSETKTALVPLVKMNGIGNKILVIDLRFIGAIGEKCAAVKNQELGKTQGVDIAREAVLRLAAGEETAFDQIMVIKPPRVGDTDAVIDIWNQDGTKARACGNGMRCVVAYLAQGKAGQKFAFETVAGFVRARSLDGGRIEVDMGCPRFGWADIPTTRPLADTVHVDIGIGPLRDAALVSMGNPHCLFFITQDIYKIELERYGPLMEHDPLFADRANISLVHLMSDGQMQLRTWERGVGLTLACGTAACAAVVAAVRRNLSTRRVMVHLPGGSLQIEWDARTGHVLMEGDAQYEFSGHVDPLSGYFIQ